ncbi:MAG: hypothetical protein ACD_76C00094G0047 [uncultured bacterium]|nr:MAG: hypothetical protein ACD_76C00094G0047 [uncultured bacterium]
MAKNLIIVESPTKAKTISKFLPESQYKILSSFGHIRDLPQKKMGIDIEHDFTPEYVIPVKSKKAVTDLKSAAKNAGEILFATDEDREGEAITWHLSKILDVDDSKLKRITFHEITKSAIEEALAHPRGIDINLVNAQQARRILDRLVGYELSPLLWKKVARGLSAGRVQSVAVRLIVEREREIQAFKPEEYWTIEAVFEKDGSEFQSKLAKINGKKLDKFDVNNSEQANKIVVDVHGADFKVAGVETSTAKKSAPTPFTTSSLQQDANNRFGFSAKQTMMLAQQLYEGVDLGSHGSQGLITYMRTDSLNLSQKFLGEAREHIIKEYGKEYAPANSRVFKTKSKGAQEAHEAIRPAEVSRTPDSVKQYLNAQQHKLYSLIWKRSVASQMNDAVLNKKAIDIEGNGHTFRASGMTINFDGFLRVYQESAKETILPELKESDSVKEKIIEPKQHFTEPPARYSDATLVKTLEEYGIGRPSTYAPTISTIIARGYVERNESKRLQPTDIAFVVTDVLVNNFQQIVDYEFTANMEEQLDDISEGKKEWVPVIREFYTPFHKNIILKDKELEKKELTEMPSKETCDKCGKPMIIKMGRFGKFLSCSGYPDCKNMKKFEVKTGVKCPECGQGDIVEKRSKQKRAFYACNRYPDCKFALWSKPTGEKCPNCGSLLVFQAKGAVGCSNKECRYKKVAE